MKLVPFTVTVVCSISLFYILQSQLSAYLQRRNEKFFYAELFTVDNVIGGVGNNIFELIALVGIARILRRTPIVSKTVATHFAKEHGEMINILEGIIIGDKKMSENFTAFYHDCCKFTDPKPAFAQMEHYRTYDTLLAYAQSYKYFTNHKREQIIHRLRVTEAVEAFARDKLVDPELIRKADHIICVHTRRGDFLKSEIHEPTTENFTLPAVDYVVKYAKTKRGSTKPLVVLIGEDKPWLRTVLKPLKVENTVLANLLPNASYPATADWEFSRVNCDTVLLTASASTFGWWLGYISKGGEVFYDVVYQRKSGFGATFEPADFFLPDWVPLNVTDNKVVEL